jgi:uncharacterized protein YbjQ (UPF0145 family)
MILVTTNEIPGRKILEVYGLVWGVAVRSRSIPSDLISRMKDLVGGEVHEYTALIAQSRAQAVDRMVEQAKSMGANAVCGIRFTTSECMSGAAEIIAYGTAVLVEEDAS